MRTVSTDVLSGWADLRSTIVQYSGGSFSASTGSWPYGPYDGTGGPTWAYRGGTRLNFNGGKFNAAFPNANKIAPRAVGMVLCVCLGAVIA